MKPAETPSRVLQIQRSVAHPITCFLLLLALFAACPMGALRADDEDPITIIKNLAAQKKISAGDYSTAVAALVKAHPDDAGVLVAEAVKDRPDYACDVVKASLQALQPANGNLDPKVVASIVADVVRTIQASNPDIVQQIISCALDVDKDAGQAILNALAGLYSGPHGIGRPPWNFGAPVPPGGSPTPTPRPTPSPTATPVTPFKPI
jgi:hypothetical protein